MVKNIVKKIEDFGGRVYIVGGYVRDKFLNAKSKDLDLEIHGVSPGELKNILSEFGEVNEIGAKFGIYTIKGLDVDFALPRTEVKTGVGHKGFKAVVSENIGLEDAMLRRDFTINGIYERYLTGEIIDVFNGVNDIKSGVIRHINSETFIEDSLRVLRACQFSARFNFKVAEETKELCELIDLSDISSERVFEELKKALLKGMYPSKFFEVLKEMGKLKPFFNEMENLSEEDFNKLMTTINNLKGKDPVFVLGVIGMFIGSNNYKAFVSRFSNDKKVLKTQFVLESIEEFLNSEKTDTDYRRVCHKTKFYEEACELLVATENNFNEEKFKTHFKEVQVPIITAKDLVPFGIKGKDLGASINKAMEVQITGVFLKEDLLKAIL